MKTEDQDSGDAFGSFGGWKYVRSQDPKRRRLRARIQQTILDFHRQERAVWIYKARLLAKQIARERGEVCADDVHEHLPVPTGVDGRAMASVFAGFGFVRFQRSRRSECHFRTIAVWTMRDG